MRLFRLLALLCVLTLLLVPVSDAGTVVLRGTTVWLSFWWNDYEITNIALMSSDPQHFVDGWCYGQWPEPNPEWKLITYHDLFYTASGRENFWVHGPLFTRVYGNFSGSLDPSGSFFSPAWMCDLLQGREGNLLAEGIAQFKWNDQDTCDLGPGQNTWNQRAVGNLYASPGLCPSGMAHFDFTFHYMLTKDAYVDPATCTVDDPAHIRKVVIRGPDLKCIGK